MRRDHRPYYIKQIYTRAQSLYVNHFLRPQFESLGARFTFIHPWHVEVFGGPIRLGEHVCVMAADDNKVRFSVWSNEKDIEGITVGDACLISPGARISAAKSITIGNSCMLASGVYITDSDWHDIYNRVTLGTARPVVLKDNVWVGDNAMIGKGVTIGENTIVGARSVVMSDLPANVIAAGNPARVVRELNPEEQPFFTRGQWFEDAESLQRGFQVIDQGMLQGNTLLGWLRHAWFPRRGE
ncbi:MAG: acyltransferase [Thermodesulfobacteriota bacterium]|nr:acyltransferase [Thermodesulfobacteriota bacterium]